MKINAKQMINKENIFVINWLYDNINDYTIKKTKQEEGTISFSLKYPKVHTKWKTFFSPFFSSLH